MAALIMWTAVEQNLNGFFSSIVTIGATSVETARQCVTEELEKNPSRRFYLTRWQEKGRMVMPREAMKAYNRALSTTYQKEA